MVEIQTEEKKAEEIIMLQLAGKQEMLTDYELPYFTHILCHRGKAQLRLENQFYKIKPNDIVIGLPAMGIKDLECSRNFKATCLLVSFDLMSKNNPDIGWGIK